MTDTDPDYIRHYARRLPLLHRVIFWLFRSPIKRFAQYCACTAYRRGKISSAALHEVIGVADTVFPPKQKRFSISRPGGGGFSVALRCFRGFLVIYARDKFCVWWSTDATPPTKRDSNGRWLIGNYSKWASSRFS